MKINDKFTYQYKCTNVITFDMSNIINEFPSFIDNSDDKSIFTTLTAISVMRLRIKHPTSKSFWSKNCPFSRWPLLRA